MARIFICLTMLLLFLNKASAQIKTVNYDIISNEINGNTPLPSEDVFFIKGVLPKNIELVQVNVKRSGKSFRINNVYSWKKPFDYEISQFELFVSEPLRGNEQYSLDFNFYSRANVSQI